MSGTDTSNTEGPRGDPGYEGREPSSARVPSDGGRGLWRLVGLAVALAFLYAVRQVLPPFVLAGMLAFILGPVVNAAQSRLRLPRGIAVLGTLLLAVGPIVAALVVSAPALTREGTDLIRRGPSLLSDAMAQVLGTREVDLYGQKWTAEELTTQLTRAALDWLGGSRAALHLATMALEGTIGGLVVLVTTFYLLLDPGQIGRFALSLFPSAQHPRVRRAARRVNAQLRRYLVGLLFLVLLMAGVTWIGLTVVFHQPYALAVALLTGVLEVIPLAGPIAAGAIAVLVAFTHGGIPTVIGVVVMYFVLRQLEDQIVIPLVQKSAVQIAPVATIFGVLAGGAIAGILGMVLAVPALVVLKVGRESLLEGELSAPSPPTEPRGTR
jgi:predicted PurR-regulated permease PerM